MKTDKLLNQAEQNENESSISSADKSFANPADATRVFSSLKTKLLNIDEWNNHSLLSSYALFDENGFESSESELAVGKFIRIALTASGKYDWIRIIEIYDAPDEFIITVKPTFDPTAENVDKSAISHFFTDQSTNNFCLFKKGEIAAFYVIGLHEKQNTSETENTLETIRNAAVNVAAYLGMQTSEWAKFCRHFLEDAAGQSADKINLQNKTKPRNYQYDAVIIGSGPNGLAAAIKLAQNNLSVLIVEAANEIGGGMRSMELTLPGFTHDVCSAIHPLTIASPFFKTLPLDKFGLEFIQPDASLAHPLDDGTAVLLEKSVAATAGNLGADGAGYEKLVKILAKNWDAIAPDILAPFRIPSNPFLMLGFGLKGFNSAKNLADNYFSETRARAMFAGNAAHSMLPLEDVPSAAFGLVLLLTAHVVGWGFPKGGAKNIAFALRDYFISLGGKIETGRRVENIDDLPTAQTILFDITPRQIIRIAGHHLPDTYRQRLETYKYGAGVFKMDFALSEPIPWKAKECFKAAAVHLGGTFEEIAQSEREHGRGKISEKPFVLLAQHTLFDSSRAPG
ncbi:MAG: NAD(P)/FAD-dependent oxidoreductase, partial [Acidobacteriota bacterium]